MKNTILKYLFVILVVILTIVLIMLFMQSNNKNKVGNENNEIGTNNIVEEFTDDENVDYVYVTLRINMPLNFEQLEEIYENSMSDYLEQNDIGYLEGDGYPVDDVFGPYAVDIEFDIKKDKMKEFKNMLKNYKFSKGSYISIGSKKDDTFGDLLGVRICFKDLNSINVEEFYESLSKEIEGFYVYKTLCDLSSKTPIYYFTDNLKEMKRKINNYIDNSKYRNNVIVEDIPISIE